MKWNKKCPKCDAEEILRIPGDIGAYGSGNNIKTGMIVLSSVKVTRYVCTKCGFTEEWIEHKADVEKLMKKYGNDQVM